MNGEAADLSAPAPSVGPDLSAGRGVSQDKKPWLVSGSQVVMLIICACATAVFLAYALNQEFDVATPLAILWGSVAGVSTFLMNWIYVTRLFRRDSPRRVSFDILPVMALAVIVGVILSTAVTMQLFDKDVRTEQEKFRFEASIQRLEEIRILVQQAEDLRNEAANPARLNFEEDPEVAPFRKIYDDAKKDFDKAEFDFLCELDGTCGTKDEGVGDSSEAKREVRDDKKKIADEAKSGLDKARQAAKMRSDGSANRLAADALVKFYETEEKLARLKGEQKRAEGSPIDDRPAARVGAFISLLLRGIGPALACFVVLIILYTVFHMLPVMPRKDDLIWIRIDRFIRGEERRSISEAANRDQDSVGRPREPVERSQAGHSTSGGDGVNDGGDGQVGKKPDKNTGLY